MVRLWAVVVALIGVLTASAAAAAPPVEAYAKLPAVERISLAPSGQRYAFVAVVDGKRRLVVVTADGKTPLYAAELGMADVTDLFWAGDSHLLVSLRHTILLNKQDFSVPRWEAYTMMAINLDTHKAFVVFNNIDELGKLVWGYHGAANIDGRWFGYFTGISNLGSIITFHRQHGPDLYRVDLDSGEVKLASDGAGTGTDSWVVDAAGRVVAHASYDRSTGDWKVFDGPTLGRVIAKGNSPISAVDLVGQGRAPGSVIMKATNTTSDKAYQILSLTDPSPPKPLDDPSIAAPIIDRSTGLWIGGFQRDDFSTPVFFAPDAEARARGAIKAFPHVPVRFVSFTSDLTRMIVETSGVGDSGTFWFVDISTGSAEPVGYEYPAVKEADVGPIQMVSWKAADGLELHGVVDLPAGRPAHDLPVVVMPNTDIDGRQQPRFDWLAQLFASRGYAVFRPNVRGSSGYGDAVRTAGWGEWGRKMLSDHSDGLAALADQGIVDAKRACIVGWGDGGYLAEAGVTLQHGIYRCAVSVSGVSDPSALLAYYKDASGRRDWVWQRTIRARLGVGRDEDAKLNAFSPLAHAADGNAPILLIHGAIDSVVTLEQSQLMFNALKARGKPVTFEPLANADHRFSDDASRVTMAKDALAFVLTNNPPDASPSAPK